jgi:uncharacterized protein with HEPN domain
MSQRLRHPRLLLEDMRDNSSLVAQFLTGKTRDDFLSDIMLQFSVVRALEIVGEACKQFMDQVPDAQQRLSQIPFRSLYAFRNRLVHGYASLDMETIWELATAYLPPVLESLRKVLSHGSDLP